MSGVLLSIHVVAAILFIGPVTVAASMFPRSARVALAAEPGNPRSGAAAVVRVLNRISRVYAALGVTVPVFGIATGARMGVLGETWLIVSMVLTAAAALILILLVLPRQEAMLQLIDGGEMLTGPARRELGRLGGFTGTFALIWVVVVILMIMRPGSTTGVH
ncbi:DUF2269 family protein [Microlunatus speluncae]|uniref:DUF2269 family protein n=1 Tax=Microlunatus speluncae TaxID=2594267 RepID=UPI0012662ECB|nr:DUF2269 family protein [Microlunatus speluncae]